MDSTSKEERSMAFGRLGQDQDRRTNIYKHQTRVGIFVVPRVGN
jgi:hypothetical protein